MTVFHYLRKKGGTRANLNAETARVINLQVKHDVEIIPHYISSEENYIADRLSRLAGINVRTIDDRFFQQIEKKWGPFSADLFADSTRAKLPVAFKFDQGQNALWDPWPRGTLYAFPPPRLILPLLTRLMNQPTKMVMVTPGWQSAIWWPALQTLSMEKVTWFDKHENWSWNAFLICVGASGFGGI